MRIAVAVDYGKIPNATSLDVVGRELFLELGKLMNKEKSFTIAALKYSNLGIGDFNSHYDCISIPNMGGFRLPHERSLSCKNLSIGIAGIDEVILGEKVYTKKSDWIKNKPFIETEVPKWKENIDKLSFIHVPSLSEKNEMIKHLKIPADKIFVIPHGVNSSFYKPSDDRIKTRKNFLYKLFIPNNPYFLHVGETNWARKNVPNLLKAFSIAKIENIPHHLIIVGKYDEHISDMAKKIPDVHVLGRVSNEILLGLLQNSDCLLYPSLHEGFGLPLVEAMACGTPSITSNVFSPPEVIADTGLLVDPYNVIDISEKIITLAKDEKLQKSLSEKSLARSKMFDWGIAAKDILNLIKEKSQIRDNFDFKSNYDIAAYRTLVTACELTPDFYFTVVQDLLKFDYSKIIKWALEYGIYDDKVSSFLIPFEKWLIEHDQ